MLESKERHCERYLPSQVYQGMSSCVFMKNSDELETKIDQRLEKPLEITDFGPLSRDEIYLERSFDAWGGDRPFEAMLLPGLQL